MASRVPSPADPTAPEQTSPLAQARLRILDAARGLFTVRGSDGVTMAEVAEAAGVSRGTVFNHFGSKHALVEAITEGVLAGYVAILDNALAAREVPVPLLVRELFAVMARGIEEQRSFYQGAFREIARISVGLEEGGVAQRLRLDAVARLVRLLSRGQARGELTRELPAEDLATAFDSLVFGTITHWLYDDPTAPLAERLAGAAAVFLQPVAVATSTEYAGPVPDLVVPIPAVARLHAVYSTRPGRSSS